MRKADYADDSEMKAPLVPVTLVFLAGILVGTSAWLPPWSFVVVGVVSAGGALWRWGRARAGLAALLLLWGCLGALRMTIWERHPDMRLTEILADEPQPVQLHGLVVDDPAELFSPHEEHVSTCVLALRHRRAADRRWKRAEGQVRVTLDDPRGPLRYGDEIVAEGRWARVPSPGNPGQYDWRAALARQRIHGLVRVKPSDGVAILRRHQGSALLEGIFRLRHRWEQLIRRTCTEEHAGLLLSLLLGQRVALDEQLKQAFVETGTVHLLVISGFNVGVIAWLLEMTLRLLGVSWRVRPWLVAAGVGGYCVLTGMQPPVVRATIMAWMILGAVVLDRLGSWPNILAAAALVMGWLNPTQLFDPSFQLSFGAVASLMVFTPRWQPLIEARLRRLRVEPVRRFIAVSVSATAAIWIGLSPLLAWYFHLVSPISMLANLLIAPLMSLLVGLATPLLMLATLCEPAMRWAAILLRPLLDGITWCVTWCHRIPGGFWYVGHPPPLWLVGYYGLVLASVCRLRLRLTPARLLICWVAGGALWVWGLAGAQAFASRWLQIDVLDVGHGDAILVRTPGGHRFMVDAGSQDAGRVRVLPFLRHEGITALDALLLTHTDEDHIGGAVVLLRQLRIGRLLTNGVAGDTMSARQVRDLADERRMSRLTLAEGAQLNMGQGVFCEVLHPPRGLVPGAPPKSNDNCVVLKLTQGAVSVLLTGDIEEAGLPWLMRTGQARDITVLKVPHHGSRLGEAGEAFFREAHPRVAILSVGRLHRLPSPDTVRALQRTGAALYMTRDDGAVSVRTDGARLEVRAYKR